MDEPIKKNVTSVVSNPGVVKKKSGLLTTLFTGTGQDIKEYVVNDVLVPSVKRTIHDVVDIILWGSAGDPYSKKNTTGTKISYSKYYDDRRGVVVGRSIDRDERRSTSSFENITYETRGEAELVLRNMRDLIDTYRKASIADLYDLSNVHTNDFTVENYGWINIDSAEIVRLIGGGYMLRMPRPIQIV